jgi:hypothetical protein
MEKDRSMPLHHVAACLVLAVLPAFGRTEPVVSRERATFQGSLEAVQTETEFNCPLRSVRTKGVCCLPHIGQFSVTADQTVNVSTCTTSGCYRFATADGDTISAIVQGAVSPTACKSVVAIKEIATITGGTGRFAGATGSLVVERFLNKVTSATTGSFHGSISCPDDAILGELR